MFEKFRKKIDKKVGEHDALPHLNSNEDEFVIKDLGVNKSRKQSVGGNGLKIDFVKILIGILVLIIIVILLFLSRLITINAAEMLWRTNLTKASDNINNKSIEYSYFKNGLMRISNDGITYINAFGDIRWTVTYNMKDPIHNGNDKFFVVADKNGYEFYIFDDNGTLGHNTVTNPIQKISMSDDGVVYVLQNDENSSFINVYRSNGKEIDLSIKSTLTGDGIPIDISTSDDGTELIVSYACLSDNNIFTKATYYNFDDAGKNANAKRIVGEFIEEFGDKFLARVHFFDNKKSCLIHDSGAYFVSTSNLSRPTVIQKYDFNDKIKSISCSKNYLAVVFSENRFVVYGKDGNKISERDIDFSYENFYLNDRYVIFINENNVKIYDVNGKKVFDKDLNGEIEYVAKKKGIVFTDFLVGLLDGVECMRFY